MTSREVLERQVSRYLVQHGRDPETFDVHAHVDTKLSLKENIENIKGLAHVNSEARGKHRVDKEQCDYHEEEYEMKDSREEGQRYNEIGCKPKICGNVKGHYRRTRSGKKVWIRKYFRRPSNRGCRIRRR